ncbi:hypothetical protein EYF80_058573 [Liparis tanakae]|uniref:Uncharacterized protein n=1 Tax=Liparis tanakae TaxID=230148 RepID=A0A4Z2ER28_9TELE|nr:hypothetical protein EYF80_058573 [Liparis tanakae]
MESGMLVSRHSMMLCSSSCSPGLGEEMVDKNPDFFGDLQRSISLVMGISLMGFFIRQRVSSEVPKQLGR